MNEPPDAARHLLDHRVGKLEEDARQARVEVLKKDDLRLFITIGKVVAWLFGLSVPAVVALVIWLLTSWQGQITYLQRRIDNIGDVKTQVALEVGQQLAKLNGAPLFKDSMPFDEFGQACRGQDFQYNQITQTCQDPKSGKQWRGQAVIFLTEPFPRPEPPEPES